jgi:hypothetical protein
MLMVQIRIVVDTHQNEKPNKKKKKHRGYAFVVYEREKDMQGNSNSLPLMRVVALRRMFFLSYLFVILEVVALKLPSFPYT